MPSSGGGTVTPITTGAPATVTIASAGQSSCISLPRYTAHLGIDECGAWGVRYAGQVNYACGTIWMKYQRDTLLNYLAQAQAMIEDVIGYPLCPRWVTEDNAPYRRRMHTRWKHVLDVGIEATSTIATGAAVSYATEPATVGPIATTVTDTSEVHVYHPGTGYEIEPSLVTIVAGQVTLYIPRCRLVKVALWDNAEAGLDFNTPTNFEASVDVVRVYNDPSTQAVLVWPTGKACCRGCDEETDTGCEAVINPMTGYMQVTPGVYASGTWAASSWLCTCPPPYVRLNYRAGATTLSMLAQDAIIRLAHSLMPEGPCGCDVAQTHWKRDRFTPDFIGPERMNVPWGFTDGAWYAWLFANQLEQKRMSVL